MKADRKANYCIVGRSISGLAVAAALARENNDSRVTLVFSPPTKKRRLLAGCSLRYSTLQRIAKCTGLDPISIAQRIAKEEQSFRRLTTGIAHPTSSGISFEKPIEVINGASLTHPLGVSSRHEHILDSIQSLIKLPNLHFVERTVNSYEDIVNIVGDNDNCTLLNATPRRNLFEDTPKPKVKRYVVAVQAPMKPAQGGIRAPLSHQMAYAPFINYPEGVHVAFFTPFSDPLSTEATWYGINTRVVSAGSNRSYEEEIQLTTEGLMSLSRNLGLEVVDSNETLGAVVMPVSKNFTEINGNNFIDINSSFSSGAPAIYVDGMLSMATGASAWLETRQSDIGNPDSYIRSQLHGIRLRNKLVQALMLDVPFFVTRHLLKTTPGIVKKIFVYDWVDAL